MMRHLTIIAAAAFVASAACSSTTTTSPTADAFGGTYTLSAIGGWGLPRMLDSNTINGAYDVLLSAGLAFPNSGSIVVSTTTNTYASAKASPVAVARIDTFDLGRLPTQAFLLRQGSAADTIAGIIVPAINQLALDYRGAFGLGTYLFIRR